MFGKFFPPFGLRSGGEESHIMAAQQNHGKPPQVAPDEDEDSKMFNVSSPSILLSS